MYLIEFDLLWNIDQWKQFTPAKKKFLNFCIYCRSTEVLSGMQAADRQVQVKLYWNSWADKAKNCEDKDQNCKKGMGQPRHKQTVRD